MKKIKMTVFIAAILSAAMLAGCNQPMENPEFTTNSKGEQIITEESAKRAAADKANLTVDDVQHITAVLNSDDDRDEYDVEFIHDGYEYEIEVDAADGSIEDFSKEPVDKDDIPKTSDDETLNSAPDVSDQVSDSEPAVISEDEALAKVLEKAGLAEVATEDLIKLEIEFEIDDGIREYEIDFRYDSVEYDSTVKAENGEIIKFEAEKEKEEIINDKPVQGNNDNVGTGTDVKTISEAEAIAKALEHAGLTEEDITILHIGFDADGDDGVKYEYDIEFYVGNEEYDYEINAIDGTIVDFDKETEFGKAPEKPVVDKSTLISREEAISAALKHAQVDEGKVYDTEVELDEERGVYHYDVDFNCEGYEYSYEINAVDGSIIKNEKELDD